MAVDAAAGPAREPEAVPPWALAVVPLAGLVALLHGLLRRPSVLVVATLAGSGLAITSSGADGGSLTAGDVASVLLVGAVALMFVRRADGPSCRGARPSCSAPSRSRRRCRR